MRTPLAGRTLVRIALLLGVAAMAFLSPARAKEPYRRVFISASRSMNVDANLLARDVVVSRYVVPECPKQWSVRKYRLFGGKQEGVDVVWIDNGKLQICVVPTRGMGIFTVLLDGARVLGWDSPVKEVVHPNFINLNNRGGLGWLEGFNEWLCRCGLESNGAPGTDTFTGPRGEEAKLDLTLHGRIANLPAQEVELVAEREPPFRISLRGFVHERTFHGPKLELATELITEPGSRAFQLRDTVSNRGGQRQEFQMLYHANFGPPMLEQGSKLYAAVESVAPLSKLPDQLVKEYDQFAGPSPGAPEQVFAIKPLADHSGRTLVMIANRAADKGASIRFDTRELPCLSLWKNLSAVEDGYVTGIEPGTNFPNKRQDERAHGRVPTLSPGASHLMVLDFAIHTGATEVAAVAQEIAKIQGDRRPLISPEPEPEAKK